MQVVDHDIDGWLNHYRVSGMCLYYLCNSYVGIITALHCTIIIIKPSVDLCAPVHDNGLTSSYQITAIYWHPYACIYMYMASMCTKARNCSGHVRLYMYINNTHTYLAM